MVIFALNRAGKRLNNRLCCSDDRKAVKNVLKALKKSASVMILQKLDSQWTFYLDSALAFSDTKRPQKIALFGREKWIKDVKIVPDSIEEALDISFIAPHEFLDVRARLVDVNPQWENAVMSCKFALQNQIHPKLVAVGGKGVGKSTMLKWITNRLVQDHGGKVLWIELDPGQAEFTLPGCLSVTLVTSPILGPNFTHVEGDNVICKLYLGSVNVSDVVERYAKCVAYIVSFLQSQKHLEEIPWVVNTMGFNRGLGISLLKKSVASIKPTTFVEIRSRFHKKNYECNLGEFCSQSLQGCNFLSFSAIPESAGAKDMGGNDLWGIPEAYKLRDIVVLSYLGQSFAKPIQSVTPYAVSFDSVSLQLLQCTSKSPESPELVLNMALVSMGTFKGPRPLSGILHNDVIIETKGFGIIRAVDQVKKLYYIVTNLNEDMLTEINCLTCGSIFLPKGVYLTQKIKESSNPYLETEPKLMTPLNSPWQRSASRPIQN